MSGSSPGGIFSFPLLARLIGPSFFFSSFPGAALVGVVINDRVRFEDFSTTISSNPNERVRRGAGDGEMERVRFLVVVIGGEEEDGDAEEEQARVGRDME